MYGKKERMMLRHYLEEGLSKAAAARMLGVDRNTVHRWIKAGLLARELDDLPVRYGPRKRVPRKIDRYRHIIDERLQADPGTPAVRLFEEIRRAGYDGGYSQVKEYVRQVRPR